FVLFFKTNWRSRCSATNSSTTASISSVGSYGASGIWPDDHSACELCPITAAAAAMLAGLRSAFTCMFMVVLLVLRARDRWAALSYWPVGERGADGRAFYGLRTRSGPS